MNANFTIAKKLVASFSNRVANRRCSKDEQDRLRWSFGFSHPTNRSMMFRPW